jgi:tryptophan synthase alpha chain
MNRIVQRFRTLAAQRETAFIPYITAGDPTLDLTADLVLELEKARADIIELGVPFSDPVADGVVNQEAAQRALKHGVTLHDIVRRVRDLRGKTQVPLVLFTYFNPVLAYGIEPFARDAADAGVDGVLCVDLPPEEAREYKPCLESAGIATIFLVAPTSTPERIKLIARNATGFVYYVSRTGVTGERADLEASVKDMVARIKRHTDTPVAVGFGISTPAQAAEVAGYADGVIVGSAIVRLVGQIGAVAAMPARVGAFAKSLADAVKTPRRRA